MWFSLDNCFICQAKVEPRPWYQAPPWSGHMELFCDGYGSPLKDEDIRPHIYSLQYHKDSIISVAMQLFYQNRQYGVVVNYDFHISTITYQTNESDYDLVLEKVLELDFPNLERLLKKVVTLKSFL
jgi:hypothetical protein